MKEINRLKYSNFLANVMVYYFTLVVVYFAFTGTVDEYGYETQPLLNNVLDMFSNWNMDLTYQLFQSIPIICYAFQCHLSILPIYRAMASPSRKALAQVSGVAAGNCAMLYLIVGLFGKLTFLCATHSDVLLNYGDHGIAISICRIGIGLVYCCDYPILNFIGRVAVNDLILWFAPLFGIEIETRKVSESNIRFYTITVIFTICAVLLATLVPTINTIIGIVGSVFAVCFIFIFPGKIKQYTLNICICIF